MSLNDRFTHSKRSSVNHQHREYQDDCDLPNEDISHLNAMRNIQNIRALAAESEYIRSKVQFRAFELEFQQLRSHILGKLDEIQMYRDQQRQELKSGYQDASTLGRWRGLEKKMNQGVDDYQNQITESRQALQRSEAAMQQAMVDRLLTGRRLLKFDKILQAFNEYT
jgi:hypothetical protein